MLNRGPTWLHQTLKSQGCGGVSWLRYTAAVPSVPQGAFVALQDSGLALGVVVPTAFPWGPSPSLQTELNILHDFDVSF